MTTAFASPRRLLCTAGAMACFIAAPSFGAPVETGAVVQAGNLQLSANDLRALLSGLDAQQRQALRQDPALLKKTVGSCILQQMVLKQAEAQGYDRKPAVVAQLKQLCDSTVVQGYIASISQPPPDFPSAAEVQEVYDTNRASLLLPRQFRLAQIFISCPEGTDAAGTGIANAKLDGVRQSLAQPSTDFAAIARTVSDDRQSAAQGGEIGWVTENEVQPELRGQVLSLIKGAVSQPIRLHDGWHVLKMLDLKEASTPTLDQARPQLIARLRTMKAQANSQAYLAQLLRQNPVSIDEVALAALLKKNLE